MKNQKGFTMVELMAVIVVIGIIVLIAIPVYHGIVERMKQKSYENKVFDIETKAEIYAASTNRLLISVQDLVDAGKLETDNEEGDILSPIDNERMNCYIIETVFKDGNYESTLTDENNCDTADRIANNQDLELIAKIGTRVIDPNNWQKEDVTLEASFQANEELYSNITYKWLHINEEISGETTNIYKTRTETITNNIFTVAVHATKAGEEVNLTKSVRVKVDKQPPIVDQVGTKVLAPETWAQQKDIQLKGIDYDGSGIKGFYVYSGNNVGCTNDSTKYSNVTSIKRDTGVQHVCTMDNVGNVSEPYDVLVDKIDKTDPKFVYSSWDWASMEWQTSYPYTLKFNTEDHDSGLSHIHYCNFAGYGPTGKKIEPVVCDTINLNGVKEASIEFETNFLMSEVHIFDKAMNQYGVILDSKVDLYPPETPVLNISKYTGKPIDAEMYDASCEINDANSAGNVCTITVNFKKISFFPSIYTSYQDRNKLPNCHPSYPNGWYFMATDLDGNLLYPKTHIDDEWEHVDYNPHPFPRLNTNHIAYIWGIDKAGNESAPLKITMKGL